MKLAYKQLTKQVFHNKVFIILLFLLIILTSLSFFFVKFSIDGNMSALDSLVILSENQKQYKNALNSNTSLAYNFFVSMVGLTAFVFFLFFYWFFRSNKAQIGCLKTLGFKDRWICNYFILFTAVISIIGALLGLFGGYFLSSILIDANTKTYTVNGLVKGIGVFSFVIGLTFSTFVFCLTTLLGYSFIRGKETGVLITGDTKTRKISNSLLTVNKIVNVIPIKNKFSLRIALRKPFAILLILIAVMSFNICIILGQSLNMSSQKVFKSQTIGHNYNFNTYYSQYRTEKISERDIAYLHSQVEVMIGGYTIEQKVVGLYNINKLYELINTTKEQLSIPDKGSVYINKGLSDMYGVHRGDILIIKIKGIKHNFTVSEVSENAEKSSVYINGVELSGILGVVENSYNGVLSMEPLLGGESMVSKAERIDELDRNAVSNNISGVINQVIGGLVGCILIFLAIYISFQDNIGDMLILHLIGYRPKEIRKMFIDGYRPIIYTIFLMTMIPSIEVAKSIQRSLSITTKDYMPFGISMIEIILLFILLNIVYWFVQSVFLIGIHRILRKSK